jgi:hypothetical protein
MIWALNLFDSASLGDWLMPVLAVIGAAAVGGIGVGLIIQISARLLTAKKAPPRLVQVMRVLGAITVGLLVAMILFRSGGPGGGGSGSGGGKDSGKGPMSEDLGKDTAKTKDDSKTKSPTSAAATLRIEVVGSAAGERRHYHVKGDDRPHTLDEVRALLAARLKQQPPLEKVVIVLYENSPDKDTQIVRSLVDLARDNRLTPDISEPQGKAP